MKQNCRTTNKARVTAITEEAKKLQTLLAQTFHMQCAFESFPEVLLRDATHCTNELKMPLSALLVQGGRGVRQVARYTFVA